MNSYIKFTSSLDYKLGLKWMLSIIDNLLLKKDKHNDPKEFEEECEELIDIINTLSLDIKNYENLELINKIWEQLLALNDEDYSFKSNKNLFWGQWRLNKTQEFNFGYTEDCIFKSFALKNSDQKVNIYKKIPPSITWELKEVKQKDLTFYTTIASIEEIEQVTSVPSLSNQINSIDAGKRILDRKYKEEEWQRRPDPSRIQSITHFVEMDDNIIANAPMLFIKDSEAISIININNKKNLVINFEKFLIKPDNQIQLELFSTEIEDEILIDHVIQRNILNDKIKIGPTIEKEDAIEIEIDGDNNNPIHFKDCRPIWLIDGQHRVRGLSRSSIGSKLKIPIIIFPSEFQVNNAAKIFAEINTLQVSLTPLHKLFMQHRFNIPSPSAKRNFEVWEDNPSKKMQSRANNLAYELLAKLASREDSALLNKIKLLDQNEHEFYVKADQWVNYARSWFLPGGPYHDPKIWGATKAEIIYHEVNDYFSAFIETVNHDQWADGKERWPNTTRGKSLLQSATHFRVLIRLFIDVYARIPTKKGQFNKNDYKKILAPFKWVDWLDKDLKSKFSGGGEKGRTNLYVWMYDALKAKSSYPREIVMSKKKRSIPGAGILSPPAASEIIKKGTWPSKGKMIVLISSRPINARSKPNWVFYDNKGFPYDDILQISNEDDKSTCVIYHADIFTQIESFSVSVSWANATDPPGTTKIKIKKNPL